MSIEVLVGKTISNIEGMENDSGQVTITTSDGVKYVMYHEQDCCESVRLYDVCGYVKDLIGEPILEASKRTNSDNPPSEYSESFTWTFYELATIKGSVTLRWLGESNGYYGEEVDFCEIGEKIRYW